MSLLVPHPSYTTSADVQGKDGKRILELEGEIPQLLPAGTHYNVLRKTVIRAGFEGESEKAGVLAKNTRIVALEERINEKGTKRVHYDGGWVSEKGSDAQPILQVAAPGSMTLSPSADDSPRGVQPSTAPVSSLKERMASSPAGVAVHSPRSLKRSKSLMQRMKEAAEEHEALGEPPAEDPPAVAAATAAQEVRVEKLKTSSASSPPPTRPPPPVPEQKEVTGNGGATRPPKISMAETETRDDPEREGKTYVAFLVKVAPASGAGEQPRTVAKRFSEFDDLR